MVTSNIFGSRKSLSAGIYIYIYKEEANVCYFACYSGIACYSGSLQIILRQAHQQADETLNDFQVHVAKYLAHVCERGEIYEQFN